MIISGPHGFESYLGSHSFCGLSQALGMRSRVLWCCAYHKVLPVFFPFASYSWIRPHFRTGCDWWSACLSCYGRDRFKSLPKLLKSFSLVRILAWFPLIEKLYGIEVAWAVCRGSLYIRDLILWSHVLHWIPRFLPFFSLIEYLKAQENKARPSRSILQLLLAI